MEAYGLSYWEVMEMPIEAFWTLSRQIDRIRAERDLRALRREVAGTSRDAATIDACIAQLRGEMGHVVREAPALDRAGLHSLKALSKAK